MYRHSHLPAPSWPALLCHTASDIYPPSLLQPGTSTVFSGQNPLTKCTNSLAAPQESDPELFHLAKVGLGCLGVVSEVTLQCVPAQRMVEHTFPSTLAQVRKNHAGWLAQHKHLRYMWIPHTDDVIVVTNDPLPVS